ncbi:hypothetical protein L209DRAFT_588429 [Thermothelomyces heterothallicus CBS 203.75]
MRLREHVHHVIHTLGEAPGLAHPTAAHHLGVISPPPRPLSMESQHITPNAPTANDTKTLELRIFKGEKKKGRMKTVGKGHTRPTPGRQLQMPENDGELRSAPRCTYRDIVPDMNGETKRLVYAHAKTQRERKISRSATPWSVGYDCGKGRQSAARMAGNGGC